MASNKKRIALTLQEHTSGRPHWAWKLGRKRTNPGEPEEPAGDDYNPGEEPARKLYGTDPDQARAQPGTSGQSGSSSAMADEGIANPEAMDTSQIHSRTKRSAAGGSASSGAQSGLRGTVKWPDGLPIPESRKEQPYHRDYSFRLSSDGISYKTVSDTNGTGTWVKFPVFEFPFWSAGFCLSEEELAKILEECTSATTKSITVKIFAKTATLPFATNVSTSGIGNNNVGVQIMQFRKDINKYRKGKYIFADDVMKKCWGSHLSSLDPSTGDYSEEMAALGAECVTRNWNSKFEFWHEHSGKNVWNGANTNTYSDHLFPWRQFLTNFRNATFEEGEYDTFTYIPQNGTFHCQTRVSDNLAPESGTIGFSAHKTPSDFFTHKTNNVKVVPPRPMAGRWYTDDNLNTETLYRVPSSRLQYTKTGAATLSLDDTDLEDIPTFSIGIDPIYNGDIATLKGKLVNVNVDIRVQVVTIIEEVRGTNYQHRYGGNIVQKDPKFGKWRVQQQIQHPVTPAAPHILVHNTNTICNYSGLKRQEDVLEKVGDQMKVDLSYNRFYRAREPFKANQYVEDYVAQVSETNKNLKYNLRKRKYKLGTAEEEDVTKVVHKAALKDTDEHYDKKDKLHHFVEKSGETLIVQQVASDSISTTSLQDNNNSILTPEQRTALAKMTAEHIRYNKEHNLPTLWFWNSRRQRYVNTKIKNPYYNIKLKDVPLVDESDDTEATL